MSKTTDEADGACTEAVVICTRNRPDDLRRTLESIARQDRVADLLVLIVDASDDEAHRRNEAAAVCCSALNIRLLAYPALPSLPRQRNFGIDHLPNTVEVVHFLDDDVTVLPGYFRHLSRVLGEEPQVGGVGGRIIEPDGDAASRLSPLHRLFLLAGSTPGRVLPSGHTTPAQTLPLDRRCATQWLSGCASSYRRVIFEHYRFDEALSGYALLEDLDFSYRVGQSWKLLVQPRARLIHHASPVNRYDAARRAHTLVTHGYWFVEKNIRHPLRKPAFWWAFLGQLLAVTCSAKPEALAWRKGLLRGLRAVLQRTPALTPPPEHR